MIDPSVRARHMKTMVETIDGLAAPVRSRIHASLPAGSLSEIENAVPAVWLPMSVNVALTETTSRELGPEGARDFYRRMVLAEYKSETFKSFLATVARLLGLTPSTYVKLAPRGWELVFKNCGKFRPLERRASSARLEYTNIPALCMRNDLWIESVRSSFYSAFDLTSVPGEVLWDDLDFVARKAIFLFNWES